VNSHRTPIMAFIVPVGSKVKVTACVWLGSLAPGDGRVQAYYGVVNADGKSGKGSHADLSLCQSAGT
jgi:hypothetical protein